MAFWKPGGKKPEASLPLSAEVDREGPGDGGGRLVMYNRNENVALQTQRERLPIFKTRDAILHLVETRATIVLVGQTGCGKTTQVPQYLVEAGWTAGGRLVACTQPRRVAAMTVASRVADEMGVTLGAEVGYAVRFENVSTPGTTRVRFCTDGVLLRELMEDPLLSRYSVVMVDEAHATLVCGQGGNGGGAASMFGVSDEIDVSIGTMSKAIGSHGGFVACSGAMKRVLASSARSAIFSTSLPAPVIAAASAALHLDRSVGREARTKLYARIDAFAAACAGRIRARHVATTCGHMSDDAVNEWRGVFVTRKSPVVSVVVGSESVALSASHGLEDVRELAGAVGDLVSGGAVGSAATAKL